MLFWHCLTLIQMAEGFIWLLKLWLDVTQNGLNYHHFDQIHVFVTKRLKLYMWIVTRFFRVKVILGDFSIRTQDQTPVIGGVFVYSALLAVLLYITPLRSSHLLLRVLLFVRLSSKSNNFSWIETVNFWFNLSKTWEFLTSESNNFLNLKQT